MPWSDFVGEYGIHRIEFAQLAEKRGSPKPVFVNSDLIDHHPEIHSLEESLRNRVGSADIACAADIHRADDLDSTILRGKAQGNAVAFEQVRVGCGGAPA